MAMTREKEEGEGEDEVGKERSCRKLMTKGESEEDGERR